MRYLNKQLNGADTRNNFVRSMDLYGGTSFEQALENYNKEWFSSKRKQYLNQAFKLVLEKQLFWPARVIPEMLDEIYVNESDRYDAKKMAQDIDNLKSKYQIWASKRKNQPVTSNDILKEIKSFEMKYRYSCPESFKFYWMNNGAFITLSYGIKFEDLVFPGMDQAQSLSKLQAMGLEVLTDHDHDVDERLFKLCYFLYSKKAIAAEA